MYLCVCERERETKKSTSTLKWPRDKTLQVSLVIASSFSFFGFLFLSLSLCLSMSIEKWQQQEDKQNKNNTDDIISTTVVSSSFFLFSSSSSSLLVFGLSSSTLLSLTTQAFFHIQPLFPYCLCKFVIHLFSIRILPNHFEIFSSIEEAKERKKQSITRIDSLFDIHSTDKHQLEFDNDTILLLFLIQSIIPNQTW